MKKSTTKRALLTSASSLLLCASMFVGTTFAWFTDSVSSDFNQIVAGNLDVELEYSTNMTDWKNVDADTNVFKEGSLWEPGYTEVVYLRVSNVGSLALKYRLGVKVANETLGKTKDGEWIRLSDYIEYGVVEEVTAKYADRNAARAAIGTANNLNDSYDEEFTLIGKTATETDSDTFALVVYMPETVGSEANHNGTDIPLINLGLSVLATQYTYETDGFDDQYDHGVMYADAFVSTDAELLAAIQDPDAKIIAISGNLTYDWGNVTDGATALKGITLIGYNGTGDSITFKGLGAANDIPNVTLKNIIVSDATKSANENSWEHTYLEFNNLTAKNVIFTSGILLKGYSTLTNCSIDSKADSEYGVWILDGKATLNNCTFTGTRGVKIHEQYATDGRNNNVETVVIDGCTFDSLTQKPGVAIDSLDTQITIKNSTFINCQAGDQGEYIYETDNTVPTLENNTVRNDAKVSTAEELTEAIKNGDPIILTEDITMPVGGYTVAAGKEAVIDLGGNNLTLQSTNSYDGTLIVQGDLTITGNGNVGVTGINANPNSKLTLGEGVTIKTSSSSSRAIQNSGEIVINGATIEHTGTNHAIQNNSTGTLTINDATITYSNSTSSSPIDTINAQGGKVIINGGTFTHDSSYGSVIHWLYSNPGEIVINGGTFIQKGGDSLASIDYGGKLTINGGTFDSASYFALPGKNIIINAGLLKNNATVLFMGMAINQYIPVTSTATTNADGSITVTKN